MRDLAQVIAVSEAIAPAVLDADNTPAAISIGGFEGAIVCIHVGVGGITFTDTNKIEFKLTHSDDGSTYTAVTTADMRDVAVGTGGIILSLVAAHAAATVTKLAYVGGKNYLKLLADFSGTHGTGTPISAVVIKGYPHLAPVA